MSSSLTVDIVSDHVCPWCYVDDCNKNGHKGTGEYFSVSKILDAFEKELRVLFEALAEKLIEEAIREASQNVSVWLEKQRDATTMQDEIILKWFINDVEQGK